MATEVVIPMLGVTVEKGKIVQWLKQEGDEVTKGESVFVVEADKVTTEVESPASGVLAKILLEADQEVPVLSVVAVITEPGEAVPDQYLNNTPKALPDTAAGKNVSPPSGIPPAPAPAAVSAGGPVKAVPAARKAAKDKGVDLVSITPTGPDGVITLKDVDAAQPGVSPVVDSPGVSTLAGREAAAAGISLDGIRGSGVRGRIMRTDLPGEAAAQTSHEPLADFGRVIKMDAMRSAIARRLSGSAFTAPHVAFYTDIHMDPLLGFRKKVVPEFEKKYGMKLSVNDFLIKAVAMNMKDFPMLNASLEGDEIHIHPCVNIGLAVAVPNGLIVPAIAGAEQQGLANIAEQRVDLASRARNNKLTMEEMERGTFTISSLAQFDVTFFTSILNPPQSGILSVAKTREELALKAGEVVVKHVSTMGLAVDHRIIDGTLAADFLQNLKWKLENPEFTFLCA